MNPSFFIFFLLAFINLSHQYVDDLTIKDQFGQEKGFKRLVIQPNQIDRIEIDSYFRGHFLEFQLEPYSDSQDNPEALEAGRRLLENKIIQFQDPIHEKQNIKYFDVPMPISQFTLQCLFKDDKNGVQDIMMFFYMDDQLKLYVYDISIYLNPYMKTKKEFVMELFNPQYLNNQRTCTYLLQIDDHRIVSACLQSNTRNTTLVLIEMLNYKQRTFTVKYYPGQIDYESFQGGNLIYFQQNKDFINTIDFILLSNKTSSDFKVVTIDLNLKQTILRAKFDTFLFFDGFKINPYTFDALMIQDIKVGYQEKQALLLISDYTEGLFIAQLNYDTNGYQLIIRSQYKHDKLGAIQIPKEAINEYVSKVLVAVIQPPIIREVIIQDSYNPYIGWEYAITTDNNEYIGLNILDSNEKFIMVAILRINDYQPLIRVFDRKDSLQSYGFIQIPLTIAHFNDIFIEALQYSHFFLSTGETFIIYQVQPSQLIVNTQNVDLMDRLQVYDIVIPLQLTVTNYLGYQIEKIVEIIVLPYDSNKTVSIYPTLRDSMTLKSQLINIQYQCGQYQDQIQQISKRNQSEVADSFILTILDEIFSGSFDKMVIQPLNYNIEDYYFEIWVPRILQSVTNIQDFSDCRQSKVLQFDVDGAMHHRIICISTENFTVFAIEMIHDEYKVLDAMTPFYLPDLQISAYLIDFENSNIFLFTEKNRKNQNLVTMHVLKLQNQIEWVTIVRLGEKFDLLKDFKFSSVNPVLFNADIGRGILKSSKDSNGIVKIIVFEIMIDGDNFGFKLNSYLEFQLAKDDYIKDLDFSGSQRLWVLTNNNTMSSYQFSRAYKPTSENLDYTLKLVFAFQPYYNSSDNDTVVNGFYILKRFFLMLIGRNEIMIFGLEDGSLNIESNFTLPLSYKDAVGARQNYQFLKNHQGKVQFTTHSTYILIPFLNKATNKIILNIYNVDSVRQNSLYLESDIPQGFVFNEGFSRVDHFHINDDMVQVVLITNNASIQMNIELTYSMRINSLAATKLDQRCKIESQNLNIEYVIYPIADTKQMVYFNFTAINNGLMITKDEQNLNSTIMMMNKPINYGIYTLNGQANINEMFYGFNMFFNITHLETDQFTQNDAIQTHQNMLDDQSSSNNDSDYKYGNLVVEKIITNIDSLPIDFLSNSDSLIELFTIGEFIVWLDESGFFFVTQDVQASFFERYPAKIIIGCVPNLFTKFENNVFLFQCNGTSNSTKKPLIIFGATKVYTKMPKGSQPSEYYSFFGGQVLIKYVKNHERQYNKISYAAIYKHSTYQFYVALAFDIPYSDLVSQIQFYNITFKSLDNHIKYVYYPTRMIHPLRFQLDSMKITQIQLIGTTNFLMIAVKNFGLILYDIFQEKIIRYINLQEYLIYQPFSIKYIIQENTDNYYFVLDQFGIISLKIEDFDVFFNSSKRMQGYIIKPYLNYFEEEMFEGKLIAKDARGFAFVTRIKLPSIFRQYEKEKYIMRYFCFDHNDKSKFLAIRSLQDNLQCELLRNFPIKYSDTQFKFSLPHENYVFYGLQCQTDVYFFLFSWTFSLFYLHSKQQEGGLQQTYQYKLQGYNDYDQEEGILTINMIQQSFQVNALYYYLFIFLITFLMILFQTIVKSKIIKKEQRRLTRNTISLEESTRKSISSIDS